MTTVNLQPTLELTGTPPVGFSELLGCVKFIEAKITEAEKTLLSREAMAKAWAQGTDDTWRAAGCRLNKKQRLKEAEMHRRIAGKNYRELEMFDAVLKQLKSI